MEREGEAKEDSDSVFVLSADGDGATDRDDPADGERLPERDGV